MSIRQLVFIPLRSITAEKKKKCESQKWMRMKLDFPFPTMLLAG